MRENQGKIVNEFNTAASEFEPVKEHLERASDYAPTGKEYESPGEEIFEPISEYNHTSESSLVDAKEAAKNRIQKEKLIKKMSYAVAASVSVVVIGQAAELDTIAEKEPVATVAPVVTEAPDNGFEWPTVPGLGGIVGTTAPEPLDTSYITDQELMGSYIKTDGYNIKSNDGILVDLRTGKFYSVDNGKEITFKKTEPDINNMIVEGGYIVCTDTRLVYNSNGEIVWSFFDNLPQVESRFIVIDGISEDTLCYHYTLDGKVNIDTEYIYELYDLKDGHVKFSDVLYRPDCHSVSVGAFREGMLPFSYAISTGEYETYEVQYYIYMLKENGDLQLLQQTSDSSIGNTFEIISGVKDGYFMTSADSVSAVADTLVRSAVDGKVVYQYSLYETAKRILGNNQFKAKSYYDNGNNIKFNGKYICCVPVHADDSGIQNMDFLFDVIKADNDLNYAMTDYVASYFDIYFSDVEYLLVDKPDEEGYHAYYYYIDWNGNEVAGPYRAATPFTSYGYAAVEDDNMNAVHIINSKFEIVETIYGASVGWGGVDIGSDVIPLTLYDTMMISTGELGSIDVETPFEYGNYAYYYDGN